MGLVEEYWDTLKSAQNGGEDAANSQGSCKRGHVLGDEGTPGVKVSSTVCPSKVKRRK